MTMRVSSRWVGSIRRLTAGLVRFGSVLRQRQALAVMGQLDDHLLRDIGLTRHDLWSARAEPLFRDPTVTLVGRAHERRIAVRAAARDALACADLRRLFLEESRHA